MPFRVCFSCIFAKVRFITAVGGEGILRCRLLDMGLIPHTRVHVSKIAPMGDPMELFLRGYTLTLRKEDARSITIEEDAE